MYRKYKSIMRRYEMHKIVWSCSEDRIFKEKKEKTVIKDRASEVHTK